MANNTTETNKKVYTCTRCGYFTSVKCNVIAHLKRGVPCEPKLKDIPREEVLKLFAKSEPLSETTNCPFCDKEIVKTNISRHKKICKQRNEDNIQDELERLRNQVSELTKRLDGMSDNNKPQVVNNITNNNTYNLQINTFGNEDTSHLSHELLSHCLLNPSKGLPKLIDTIHYHPEKPNNRNLRYKSTKNNSFEKYVDSHWMECDGSNTLDELIRKGYRILNTHYMEYFINNPEYYEDEIKQRALERFRFLSDKTCNEYHSVKRELRLLIKDRTVYVLEPPSVADETNNETSYEDTGTDDGIVNEPIYNS